MSSRKVLTLLASLFRDTSSEEQYLTKLLAFQVSDGFIIKTYCSNVNQVNAELQAPICKEVSATCELTSIYLVEPHRVSSTVLKFSGIIGICNHTDKHSVTIMAFSHFVLESSVRILIHTSLQLFIPLARFN